MSIPVSDLPPVSLKTRIIAVISRIIGAPDYHRYLEHMKSHHPGCTVLTYNDFARERMNDRYNRPGNRCC